MRGGKGRVVRVVMTAYVCNPTRGSEAGLGWSLAEAAAAHHDVTLLTQSIERADIEAARRASPALAARLAPVYVDVRGAAPRREGRGTRLHHHR